MSSICVFSFIYSSVYLFIYPSIQYTSMKTYDDLCAHLHNDASMISACTGLLISAVFSSLMDCKAKLPPDGCKATASDRKSAKHYKHSGIPNLWIMITTYP